MSERLWKPNHRRSSLFPRLPDKSSPRKELGRVGDRQEGREEAGGARNRPKSNGSHCWRWTVFPGRPYGRRHFGRRFPMKGIIEIALLLGKSLFLRGREHLYCIGEP